MDVIPELAAYRKSAGLTQREAAEKANVARETWARWEKGKRKIDADLVPTIAEMTGIAPQILRPDLAGLMRPLKEAAE